ncbi:MAG: class I SAM-dependent methyltransferase, partial [Rhodospirillaceae bacterium]
MSDLDTRTLFSDKSDLYAAARPQNPAELFEFIASVTERKGKAWDCATGNGQAAIGLANHFQHVEASDVSADQISNAFPHQRIRYSVQPAERTTFDESAFDLVNVAQALHWFDLRTFWTEVRRVLKPGGIFVAYCYAWSNVSPEIDEAVETHVRDPIREYWAPNNRLCWNGYGDIDFPFDKEETPVFEIKNHWNFDQFMNYLHTWSAVRRRMQEADESFFEAARKQVLEAWGRPDEP